MNRVVGTGAAVVVAAVVAFLVMPSRETTDTAAAPIEKLIAAGRIADARAELARRRSHLDAATIDYLDGLALLAEAKDREAAPLLERARRARPGDWRIVSAAAAAIANAGDHRAALALVETYVKSAPDDERGLAALAGFRLDERAGAPDAQAALAALDRLEALKQRVAPPGDPTAVPAARIRLLRARSLVLLGRGFDAHGEAGALVGETPQDPEAWFLLGESARLMSPAKPEEALDAYRRAIDLAPASRRFGEQFVMASLQFVIAGTEPERVADAMQVVDALLARQPDDVALLILKARVLVHGEQTDYRRMDAAADLYRSLAKRQDLSKEQRLAVLRNLAVLLFDVKVGGRPGDYSDEAHELLKKYFELGGKDDAKLHDMWETLEKRKR